MTVRYVATPMPTIVRTIMKRRSPRLKSATSWRGLPQRVVSLHLGDHGLQLTEARGNAHDRLSLALGPRDGDRRRAVEALGDSRLLVAGDLGEQGLAVPGRVPAVEIEAGNALGQFFQERLGHVPSALRPLVGVEELDVVPGLVLLTG